MLLDDYNLHVVILCLFYVMMASSWNLLAGYTGQVSFAHAAFAGIGAYTTGILSAKLGINPWVGVTLGVLVAGVLGLAVGVLCLRMGGIYLSLTTLGFSEILHIVITNEYEITRGTMGLQVPGLLSNYSKIGYFYIFLAGALLTLIILYKLIHSNVGLNFRAVQNDERAAASLGVNVVRVRVLAFTVSSALAGLAGGLYGHYLLLVTPEIPSLNQQFLVLSMTVIGGMGGKQTAGLLLARDPDFRIIASSGYSNDSALGNHRAEGFSAALAKPFRIDDVRRVLGSVLHPVEDRGPRI